MSNPASTQYDVRGAVAVITLTSPPVNGLGYALRAGIVDGIDRAQADPAVTAVVITGSDRAFSGGADVREFGTPKAGFEPNLREVIKAVESSTKPVVAAIAGVCLGGGLELALGAHFRVAKPDASLGLPEVKLGLLPGAGGTQRLPRLIGLDAALNMIVSGAPVPASQFEGTPLIDAIITGDLLEGAVAFAQKAVADKLPLKRARDVKIKQGDAEAFLQFARNMVGGMSKNFPAPLKCVEAVAASVGKSFDAGCDTERALFLELMQTPESRALRHIFQAERAASKVSDIGDDVKIRDIKSVGIIGAGTMGGGIAMSFINAGIAVVLLEQKQEALDKGLATIRKNYESSLKKGKITQAKLDERLALITPTLSYDGFKNVDLAIEAVFESIEVKEQVFKTLDEVMKPGSILASNTSALNLDEIAAFTKRPEDVIGLHFFSPANVMRLLEVVRGAKTSKEVLATSMALAKKIKKIAVVSGVCDGFIGNRIVARYGQASNELLNAGASPAQIDNALQKFGLAMGIYRMGDLAGLDIGYAGRKRRKEANPEAYIPIVADRLAEAGRFGQKTGAGWYRYEAGKRDPIVDPAVDKIIEDFRTERGLKARKVSDEEVIERCIY
ncbi:MAG: hypothetical protein RLZZ618_2620, partial [Pseudomonadota bacterium]